MKLSLPVEFSILFLMIFARTGSLIMTMPMFGERAVPARIRLIIALFLALMLAHVLRATYRNLTSDPSALFGVLMIEILVGLGLGAAIRFLTLAADIASHVISQSLGLSLGDIFNPSLGTQSTVIGTFLTMLLVVMMFALDVHHALLAAIVGTYRVLPPGQFYPLGDFTQFGIQMASQSFVIALQIAAPFILFGILFNVGLGILSRLIPQLQVIFIATPLSIFAGLALLALFLGTIIERLVGDLSGHLSSLGGS